MTLIPVCGLSERVLFKMKTGMSKLIKILFFLTVLVLNRIGGYAQDFDKIRMELEVLDQESISLRSKVRNVMRTYGANSVEMEQLNRDIMKYDSVALVQAVRLIEDYGWLGQSKIGTSASNSLFLIIQHAAPDVIEKYYPLLEKAVKKGEASPANMALMRDRIQVSKKLPQSYGTQYFFNEETRLFQLYPTVKPRLLDKNRKKVGLKPIKEYLKENNITAAQ